MSKKHDPKDEVEIQPVLYGPPVDEFAELIDEPMEDVYGPPIEENDLLYDDIETIYGPPPIEIDKDRPLEEDE